MSVKIRIIILLVVIAILIVGFVTNKFKQNAGAPTDIEIDTSMVETKNIEDIWKIEEKENFIVAMSQYIGEKCEYGDDMKTLNDEQRVLYITQALEMEVNNFVGYPFMYEHNSFMINLALHDNWDNLTILYENIPEVLEVDLNNAEE